LSGACAGRRYFTLESGTASPLGTIPAGHAVLIAVIDSRDDIRPSEALSCAGPLSVVLALRFPSTRVISGTLIVIVAHRRVFGMRCEFPLAGAAGLARIRAEALVALLESGIALRFSHRGMRVGLARDRAALRVSGCHRERPGVPFNFASLASLNQTDTAIAHRAAICDG